MRWSPGGWRTLAVATIGVGCTLTVCSERPVAAAQAIGPAQGARADGSLAGSARHSTSVTIDGRRAGPVFDGVGAISAAGGNARLLIDYPRRQRTQILDFLFGPGGADLQILKLEIGDDSAPTDGADPSIEHSKGKVDCDSGYDWWLAGQAAARDPRIQLVALQWGAPDWVGSVWSQADIGYVINWLNCARAHRLKISGLGGWDENGYNISWFEHLRRALDAHGYGSVKLMAADGFPGFGYEWARTFQVADAAAADPEFKAALGVIAVHDTCGWPTTGYLCQSTATARHLGLPLWESELGAMSNATSAASMARTINNGFIEARITGFLEWPLTSAMPPGLFYSGRGMVAADEPQRGSYTVNAVTWAVAQTTQFVRPGWRYVTGADGDIGDSGTYVGYVAPGGHNWSLVTENTGREPGQRVHAQVITVRLTGGLATKHISAWSTDLTSSRPSTWFVRQRDVRVSGGTFSYSVKPGYAVTFTSTTGQSHLRYASPSARPMRLPYTATPDGSNEAWGLGTQEGAFIYQRCRGGLAGRCLEQMAGPDPVYWQKPQSPPNPCAIIGSTGWSHYTVSASVLIPKAADWAGVIGRYSDQTYDVPSEFDGYMLQLWGSGTWRLLRNAGAPGLVLGRAPAQPKPKVLASGKASGIRPGTWHAISLRMSGSQISALIDGKTVASKRSRAYRSGLAGIASSWAPVQFSRFTIR
jgi:hypothetical protein